MLIALASACASDLGVVGPDALGDLLGDGPLAVPLPALPWPVLLLIDTSDSMWYRREVVVQNLERLALFDAALPQGAQFELRRIDAPTLLPTLCDLPRAPGDVHAMMEDVATLMSYATYDRVDNAYFSNGARSMPTWYLADYLARNAPDSAQGRLTVWSIQDVPDGSYLFRDVDAAQTADALERLWVERGGAGVEWNVVAEIEQTGEGIPEACYADATNLASLAEASEGRFVHLCSDRAWAEAIVDSAWEHYLQPVTAALPADLPDGGWRLIADRGVGPEAACAVDALPADRVVPRCLPFVRDGDLAVFRAADVLQLSSLTLEAEAP